MLISLSQSKFATVGPKDYAFLMQWKWYYHHGYAVRKNGTVFMHRVILEQMGFKNFVRSDHINRDKLDNCRYNLRPATSSQSRCNQNRRRDNTSGYIGVCWDKGKWRADMTMRRKRLFLGYYDNPKRAAQVRNKAALKYHGKFAVLNKIK